MLGLRVLMVRAVLWQAAFTGVVLMMGVLWPRRSLFDAVWLALALCTVLLPALIFVRRKWTRIRQELLNNEERFCIKCGYKLANSPDSGKCPECGVEYEIKAVQEAWRRAYPREI